MVAACSGAVPVFGIVGCLPVLARDVCHGGCAGLSKQAHSQVPYATGGSTDIVARIIAPHMSEMLGTPIFVENKPGAGSAIGVDAVAKAAPDGYTLGIVNIAFVANPSLRKSFLTTPRKICCR